MIVTLTWYIYALAKDCGPLGVPSNGSMFGNQTTYPNEVSFKCDEGFILRGSQVRRCSSEGTWSGAAASCEGARALMYTYRGVPISQTYKENENQGKIWEFEQSGVKSQCSIE